MQLISEGKTKQVAEQEAKKWVAGQGYTDDDEETTTAFQAIRKQFQEIDTALAHCKALLDQLEEAGYPISGAVEEKQRYEEIALEVKSELRPMVHGLDVEAVEAKAKSLREPLDELTTSMQAIVDSRDQRWIFVAGA